MLTQEQIERIPSYARYWEDSDREAQVQAQRKLQALALTPSHMLPFYTIGDYEKARKGQSVPIEQPKPIPIGSRQITDNRPLGQYIRETEPIPTKVFSAWADEPVIGRTTGEVGRVVLISDYMARLDDTLPMYLRAVGDS